jgi:hypothetical protein
MDPLIDVQVNNSIEEKQVYCWQKNKDSYSTFLLFGGSFNLSIITKTN